MICFSRNECFTSITAKSWNSIWGKIHIYSQSLSWISLRICSLSHVTTPSKSSAWFEGEVTTALAAMTHRRPAHQWPEKQSKKNYTVQNSNILPAITLHSQPWKNWLNNSPVVSLFICIYGCVTNYLFFHHHPGTHQPRLWTRAGTLAYQFCKAFCWWPKHLILALWRLGKWHDSFIYFYLEVSHTPPNLSKSIY